MESTRLDRTTPYRPLYLRVLVLLPHLGGDLTSMYRSRRTHTAVRRCRCRRRRCIGVREPGRTGYGLTMCWCGLLILVLRREMKSGRSSWCRGGTVLLWESEELLELSSHRFCRIGNLWYSARRRCWCGCGGRCARSATARFCWSRKDIPSTIISAYALRPCDDAPQ